MFRCLIDLVWIGVFTCLIGFVVDFLLCLLVWFALLIVLILVVLCGIVFLFLVTVFDVCLFGCCICYALVASL